MQPNLTVLKPSPLILKKSKTTKSAPERTCIGCRKRRPATELVRFGAENGHLRLGRDVPGRGAWLCQSSLPECFKLARSRKAIPRALRQDVTDAQLDELSEALSKAKDSG